VASALREWLKTNASKVMSLFHTWDEDGNGAVDKKEFRRAMRALGLQAPAAQVDAIFDEFDVDSGGSIEFRELNRLLRQGSAIAVTRKVVHANTAVHGMQDDVEARKAGRPHGGPSAYDRPGSGKRRPGSAPSAPSALAGGGGYGGSSSDVYEQPTGERPVPMGRVPSSMVEADDVANEQEEEKFDQGMRQNAMEYDAHDIDRDTKLSFEEFSAMIREREAGEHSEEELRSRFNSIDENNNNRIDLDEFIKFSLRDALSRSSARVIDLFREWDEDDSGTVDAKEFGKAIRALGFEATKEEINAVFKSMDADGSGEIEYKELNKKLRATTAIDPSLQAGAAGKIETRADLLAKGKEKRALTRVGKKGAALSASIQLVPQEGKSVLDQLKEILNENAVRVIDLFRDWDDDQSGSIDKKEFRRSIAALGYKAPAKDVDAIFDEMDKDRSGSVDYHELNKVLRRGDASMIDPSLQAGAAGKIETRAEMMAKAKEKSAKTVTHGKKGGLMAQIGSNIPGGAK